MIRISRELVDDSAVDLGAMIERIVQEDLDRAHFPPGAIFWSLPRATRDELRLRAAATDPGSSEISEVRGSTDPT